VSDEFVRVGRVADIAPGTAAAVTVGAREVALFHVDGAFYALKNACSHQGGPLCEGRIEGKTVTCPWHALVFDLETGKVVRGLARVDAFDVRVEGDEIAVCTTPRPRRPSGAPPAP
jgi:nitrite reductase (NADH) small subunit